MLASTADDIALAEAVLERIPGLRDLHIRICGVDLVMPLDLEDDYHRMIAMISRHRRGDFRHYEAETKSTKTVAQWTLAMNCQLRNQPIVYLE